MMYKSNITKNLGLTLGLIALVLASGVFTDGFAQSNRDPFAKPGYKKKKIKKPKSSNNKSKSASTSKSNSGARKAPKKPSGPVVIQPPDIQARIDYYYRVREAAAASGKEIPKVTTVLLLNEMTISGIFKTPRGYAAVVKATPIKLSYTVYPGEKFFDGQLVAIEENRLVFRKVSKLTNGKFISSVENKPLQKYSLQQELQGTAPAGSANTTESANKSLPKSEEKVEVVSPLDEMNNQPAEKTEESAKGNKGKKGKKRSTRKKSRIAKKNKK